MFFKPSHLLVSSFTVADWQQGLLYHSRSFGFFSDIKQFLVILSNGSNNCAIIFQAETSVDRKWDFFLLNNFSPEYLLHFTVPIFSEASFKNWCSKGTSSIPKSAPFSFSFSKKMEVARKKYVSDPVQNH